MSDNHLNKRASVLNAFNERERYVRERERRELTAVSRTTWYRLNKIGAVPAPRRTHPCQLWLLSDLLLWLFGSDTNTSE